jgi:hypothetical protein
MNFVYIIIDIKFAWYLYLFAIKLWSFVLFIWLINSYHIKYKNVLIINIMFIVLQKHSIYHLCTMYASIHVCVWSFFILIYVACIVGLYISYSVISYLSLRHMRTLYKCADLLYSNIN